MIVYKSGDIFSTNAEALVNTVNCVGIMGRGIALQFKNAFPENFSAYAAACKAGLVQPGTMLVIETRHLGNPKYIINFPTKRHWRGKSRIADIEAGLTALVATVRERNIRSIAIPPLGSGLGGLDWADVRPRIEAALSTLSDVEVTVFEPGPAIEPRSMVTARDMPAMTAGRAALLVLMQQYLAGLLDPFITLIELHKLMYFLQASGEPLRLRYVKAHHGPYAENLRHVLRSIEGYYVAGYFDGGDAPDKRLELIPGSIQDADAFLATHEITRAHFDRVAALVEGFETPFGLELLATVHWVMAEEGAVALDDVVNKTYAWNDRKRRFSTEQIDLAINVLTTKGWIGRTTS